jgi:hypothetical protein
MESADPNQPLPGQLLHTFQVGDCFTIYVYQGSLSKFDILIKYRQLTRGKWSLERTPKHIHWAVDLLAKVQTRRALSLEFIQLLRSRWNETKPLTSETDRDRFLKTVSDSSHDLSAFRALDSAGEYPTDFLYKLALLLMVQEKSNRHDAFMFPKLLDRLLVGADTWSIVSAASYGGRK